MRIILHFTKNTEVVPVQNYSMVISYLHKVLGNNNKYHDTFSNYSLSNLQGGKLTNQILNFENGSSLAISSPDEAFINMIVENILSSEENRKLFCGMVFDRIELRNDKYNNGWNNFCTLSPVLLRDEEKKFFCVNGRSSRIVNLTIPEMEEKIKDNILKKLSRTSLVKPEIKVIIPTEREYKVKQILVKNVINYCTQIKFNVNCSKEVAEMIGDLGVGDCTGIGFGCVVLGKNFREYRKENIDDRSSF